MKPTTSTTTVPASVTMSSDEGMAGAGNILPAMKHTPGPWMTAGRAIYTPSKWKDGRNSGQIMVAQCFAEADREDTEAGPFLGAVKVPGNDCESEANARLIAAAPELLDALKNMEAAFDLWFSDSDYLCDCLDALKQAENQGMLAEVSRLNNLIVVSINARAAIARAISR